MAVLTLDEDLFPTIILKRLKNDLEKLPDDRGMAKFEDMPVEDFTTALGKAYGCVNIDNDDDKKDCPIKKVDRKGSRYVEYKAIKDEAGKIHLRNDLEKLPDDRGFKEFEGMPVESFAATLLKGCGWNGVVGTKKKDRPIKLDRKGLGYAEYEAQMINAVKEGEANKVVIRRKRSREEEDLWLVSGIRVRFVSQELKDGSLFFREGVVFDVVGLTGMCDVEMDDTREVIRGVQPEFLENVLPRVGGWVVVLLGTYKGTFGTLIRTVRI
ncbi:protein MOS2 [Tanacetum coccineum]